MYEKSTGEWFNSLAPGKFEWNFRHLFFKQNLVIDDWGICCEIALIWMSLDFTDDLSILVQVMAWCRQATSHYLSKCWRRFLLPSGVTRPQWVNWSSYADVLPELVGPSRRPSQTWLTSWCTLQPGPWGLPLKTYKIGGLQMDIKLDSSTQTKVMHTKSKSVNEQMSQIVYYHVRLIWSKYNKIYTNNFLRIAKVLMTECVHILNWTKYEICTFGRFTFYSIKWVIS